MLSCYQVVLVRLADIRKTCIAELVEEHMILKCALLKRKETKTFPQYNLCLCYLIFSSVCRNNILLLLLRSGKSFLENVFMYFRVNFYCYF